jgi:hypothetical protein
MSVERSGQTIRVDTFQGQLVTGGARGLDEGRQLFIDGTSRMNREVQVRICEGLGVKFLGPTRLIYCWKNGFSLSEHDPSRPGLHCIQG